MALRPGAVHLVGCLAALAVAILLLTAVLPPFVDAYLPRTARYLGIRGEALDFFFVAIVPVLVWLIPPVVRGLARLTHRGHKAVLGKSGFYIRFPTRRQARFRDTFVRSLSPFAIDLLVIAEIGYFLNGAPTGPVTGAVSAAEASTFVRGLFTIPFLLLAGLVTSLLPGPWLVDALDLRLVNPRKGEVVREASVFEGLLGPIGALAFLVSFLTLAHTMGDSYEQGVVLLALWTVRMFPAVLVAVSVYRIFVEPDVLPSLEAWAAHAGIEFKPSLDATLDAMRAVPPPSARESEPASAAPSEADGPDP